MQRASVYVHFPWCLQKCPYCDFASAAIERTRVPHEAYANAVLAELDARSRAMHDRELVSVFFGGGTPSLWEPAELGRVLAGIRATFACESGSLEITVECNPSSLDEARARALYDVGVTRLSVGVQSLDDRRLRYLGRMHDGNGALAALDAAIGACPRVSGDLIFGVPGQSVDDAVSEATTLVEHGLRHVSAYALTIEPDTQFGALHRKGKLPIASEDDYADSFLQIEAALATHGLMHYEVSNYATAGEESIHNVHYWRGGDYLGLGAGAVGCLSENGEARRWRNDASPGGYAASASTRDPRATEVSTETLDAQDRIREALMLGLRTREGVDLAALEERIGVDPRDKRERAIGERIDRGDLALLEGRLTVPPGRWLALDSIVTAVF